MSPKRRKLLSVLAIVGVLAAGAGSLLLLTSFKAEAAVAGKPVESRFVRTGILEPSSQQVGIVADGFLMPARSLDIYSPVSGRVTMSRGDLKGGTNVDEGEVILTLDARRARLAFESARTDLIRLSSGFASSAGLGAGEREAWSVYIARLASADPRHLPEAPELSGRQELLAATMGVTGARHGLESAALDLADHEITAPFAGTLSGDGVPVGALVSPGTPLASLSETSRLELPLSLPVADLVQLEIGGAVTVIRPEDGAETAGSIVRIEPTLSSGSQTARVHIALDVPEGPGWIPGAFVEARIEGRRFDEAYRVPRSVLVDGHLPVYEAGRLHLLPVTVLATDAEDVLLAPDFPAGTELVETVLQSPIEGLPLRRGEQG